MGPLSLTNLGLAPRSAHLRPEVRKRRWTALRPPTPHTGGADEFADFASGDWAAEFQELASRGEAGEWSHDSVWNAITEESNALKNADRLHYEFMNPNPYLGRPDCLSIGRDMFRRGVLSEAALALEAAVRADSNFCEGWRLLSTVHAENDDDRRAIAAATKAHEADPTDLEALLSLGVSHTNELDQAEATGYMRAWLKHQPRFAHLEAQHSSQFANNPEQGNTPAATLELFKRAAATAPRGRGRARGVGCFSPPRSLLRQSHRCVQQRFGYQSERLLAVEQARGNSGLTPREVRMRWRRTSARLT